MGESIDLLILPLARTAGQEQSTVLGLFVAPPPKKAARFRKPDRLMLHLYLDGNAPLPPDQIDQILVNLAKTYFDTAGTVTTALRATAESLNQYLLDRNIRNSSTGRQAVGYFTQIVLRDNRISIAQSGLSHAFLLTPASIDHIHDLNLAGNGLGLSRTTHIRFTQKEMQINDSLVVSIQAPPSWTRDALQSFQGQGPESQRRKLLSRAGADLDSFLVHAQSGSGELRLLRPVKRPQPIPSPVPAAIQEEEPKQEPEGIEVLPSTAVSVLSAQEAVLESPQAAEMDESISVETTAPQVAGEADASLQASAGSPASGIEPPEEEPSRPELSQTLTKSFAKIYLSLGAFFKSILPDSGIFALPPSTMAFTAIAVPITIVAVAAFVYFQRGREAQYDLHISAAQESAQFAESKTDPLEQRLAWQTTLLHLDNAEIFMSTDESKALRSQAQGIVDRLDMIERIEFRPIISDTLDETTRIIRLIARDNNLYMLNGEDGVVGRAILTDEGFILDSTFQCGPGPYGGIIVGSLVDIAPLPSGSDSRAVIMGIDANGNLLQCIPGEIPEAFPIEPPDINWGKPAKIAVNGNDLYILDPQTNAVWIYRGMDVTQAPRLFFDQQIPALGDAIDMAVNQNDLYILHEDGHLTTCVYGALVTSPTRCKDPDIFTDPRPGRQSGPYIEDAYFSQIHFSPPPEPSIYMLDPETQAIYRFSVQLTFDRQFRSDDQLGDLPASSFYVNRSDHAIYMAIGNQVYYAPLP
jgi:hypothetical protein